MKKYWHAESSWKGQHQWISVSLPSWVFYYWWGHPLSTYAKFFEKLTFLTPWYAHVRVRIRGFEMLVFRKILCTYLMDGPYYKPIVLCLSLDWSMKFIFFMCICKGDHNCRERKLMVFLDQNIQFFFFLSDSIENSGGCEYYLYFQIWNPKRSPRRAFTLHFPKIFRTAFFSRHFLDGYIWIKGQTNAKNSSYILIWYLQFFQTQTNPVYS